MNFWRENVCRVWDPPLRPHLVRIRWKVRLRSPPQRKRKMPSCFLRYTKISNLHIWSIRSSNHISADPSPFSRGRRKEWRRRRVGLLVVDVLLIPCALSWRRSGVWLCRIHCQEAAAFRLFGVGCVTFSVYVGGLVSSLLGVPKLHFGTLRRTDCGTLRRMVFCFVWGRI